MEESPVVFSLKIKNVVNYTQDPNWQLPLAGKSLCFNTDAKVPIHSPWQDDNIRIRGWMNDTLKMYKCFKVKPAELKGTLEYEGTISNGRIAVCDMNTETPVCDLEFESENYEIKLYEKNYQLFIKKQPEDQSFYGFAQGGWDDDEEYVPTWVFSATKIQVGDLYDIKLFRFNEFMELKASLNLKEKKFIPFESDKN